jgi:hypothetical protein
MEKGDSLLVAVAEGWWPWLPLQMVAAEGAEEASAKALYAVANMVRNSAELRERFYAAGGLAAVRGLLAAPEPAAPRVRLLRRALGFVVDLVHLDAPLEARVALSSRGLLLLAPTLCRRRRCR